jgi:hypothetical protein
MLKFTVVYRIAIALAFIFALPAKAQRDNVWIFGDSARLDFNQPGAVPQSKMHANWGTASVADINGNMLYYVGTININGSTYGKLFDSNDSVFPSGSMILNLAGLHFNIFLPYLESDSIIDLFTLSFHPFASPGLYRTRLNSVNNFIVSSNVPIDTGYYPSDGVQAVRHGNGRDWWLIWKDHDRINITQRRNNFRLLLVSSSGFILQNNQSIGTPSLGGRGRLRFSKNGDRLSLAAGSGLIEVYDFDRCTGNISNPLLLQVDTNYLNGTPFTCEFSPSGRFLYVSVSGNALGGLARILQYDLATANPAQTQYVVKSWPFPPFGSTFTTGLQLWLDDKIYVGTGGQFNQYPDTFYTPNITHLSRIEDPDQPGAACNFNLNCVYLNGNRSYGCLPNNPNYALKEWQGSGCDTLSLTSLSETTVPNISVTAYPNPVTDFVTVQMSIPLSSTGELKIFNANGQVVYSTNLPNRFYRQSMDVSYWATGLYIAVIETEGKVYQCRYQVLR